MDERGSRAGSLCLPQHRMSLRSQIKQQLCHCDGQIGLREVW